MSTPIKLVPLECVHCQTALAANENEVAWLCAQCGQGTQLTGDGLAPVKVVWCAGRTGVTGIHWLPFWAFQGRVIMGRRETYSGHEQANPLWNAPVRFYIPAFSTTMDTVESLGAALTKAQPAFKPGQPSGVLSDCSLLPEDAATAAEFVVLTIEAERRDMLKKVEFRIEDRTALDLWLLPFVGEPSPTSLAI
jgi:hypothetical protein